MKTMPTFYAFGGRCGSCYHKMYLSSLGHWLWLLTDPCCHPRPWWIRSIFQWT